MYDEVVDLMFDGKRDVARFTRLCKYSLPNVFTRQKIPLEDACNLAQEVLCRFFYAATEDQSKRTGGYLRGMFTKRSQDYWRKRQRAFIVYEHEVKPQGDEEASDSPVQEPYSTSTEDAVALHSEALLWGRFLRECSQNPRLASPDIVELVEALLLVAPNVVSVDAAWVEAAAVLIDRRGYGPEDVQLTARRIKAQIRRKPKLEKVLCRDKRNPPNSSAAAQPIPAPSNKEVFGTSVEPESQVASAACPGKEE
jgi:hypothetical protein